MKQKMRKDANEKIMNLFFKKFIHFEWFYTLKSEIGNLKILGQWRFFNTETVFKNFKENLTKKSSQINNKTWFLDFYTAQIKRTNVGM